MTWKRYDPEVWISNPRQSPCYVIVKKQEYVVWQVWFQGNFLDGMPLNHKPIGSASTKKAAMEIAQAHEED